MNSRVALFTLAEQACNVLALPKVADALIADPHPTPNGDPEFGLLTLEDGCAGMYYAWLGASQADMPARFLVDGLRGAAAIDLAHYVLADDDGSRSVGIAAINAITEYVYRAAFFEPSAATDSFGGVVLAPGDELGMIGHFPPLARRARALGISTRIVERKAHMVTSAPGFEISLDPRVLRSCNKIICTGATLLNDSLENMLDYCRNADTIALVGPTVGCFPDALFARGIDIVAGTCIIDAAGARERLLAGDKIGNCATRYVLRRQDYPGFEALLETACSRTPCR